MRIVGLQEFLKLPENTVYQRYYGHDDIEALEFKGVSYGNVDFRYSDICSLEEAAYNLTTGSRDAYTDLGDGKEVSLEFGCTIKDACYEEKQLFAIWSEKDIDGAIEMLKLGKVKSQTIKKLKESWKS